MIIHIRAQLKSVGVKLNTYINASKEINDKILSSKSVILSEYQNIKHFCKKAMFQIGLKKFLLLHLTKKNCKKKRIKKSLELKK